MFPAIVSFAAVLGAAAITSNDVSYIRLASSDLTVEEGKQFSIDVYAYAHVPVNAVDVTLQFDPNKVEVLGVDTGQSVLTIWTHQPEIKNGEVILRGGTFRKGFLDEHLLATINLKGKSTGESAVAASDVVLLAGDGEGTPVTVAEALDSTISLYIYDENTDPENIAVAVKVNLITDLDGDGKVTLKDVSSFMASWHKKDKIYDFNGDGRMTFRDFSIILANYFF
ncbi:hypothetical protein KC851_01710 [Candidatus Kaiserbacteria bacterium]|nr:hypothetical protein [Candidatus Kaiserbacteria bacterium]